MKQCVITGASLGVGRSLSKKYASMGYSLILISRNKDNLENLKEELLKEYKIDIDIIPYDLTNETIIFSKEILNSYSNIEVLINNAGMGIADSILYHDPIDEEKLIDLNIKALTILSIEFAKYFKDKGYGRIINISSVGSMMPGAYISSYYASKAYVSSFTYSINLELKQYNVYAVAFNLPRIDTDFDLHAKRKSKLKKGKNPMIIANKIYKKMNSKKGIINIGLSTKLMNLLSHIFPKSLISKCIGSKLK
jgi:short-subunit dehydrogenase